MVILLKSLLLRVHIGLIHHQNPKSKTIMLCCYCLNYKQNKCLGPSQPCLILQFHPPPSLCLQGPQSPPAQPLVLLSTSTPPSCSPAPATACPPPPGHPTVPVCPSQVSPGQWRTIMPVRILVWGPWRRCPVQLSSPCGCPWW